MSDFLTHCRQRVEQFPDNAVARFSLAKALLDAGQFAEARDHFNTALAAQPDWMAVAILLGKCELALGNKAAARAAFEKALNLAVAQHHEGPQSEMEQLLREL